MPIRHMSCVAVATILAMLAAKISLAAAPSTRPTTAPATQPKKLLGIVLEDLGTIKNQAKLIDSLGGNLLVNGVIKGSRADRMGFQTGDVIVRINGEEMKTGPDVVRRAGDRMEQVDILRNKQPMTLTELLDPAFNGDDAATTQP